MTPTPTEKKKPVALAVREYLVQNAREISIALPRHLNVERFLRVSFTVLSQNPDLYQCERRSLLGSLVQLAQLGLEPGVLGQAWLVSFNNRKRGTIECQIMPGYKGLMQLGYRSGAISLFDPQVVRQGDHYRRVLGTHPAIEHVPSEEPIAWLEDVPGSKGQKRWARRDLIAAYCVAHLKHDDARPHAALRRDEIEWHRDRYSRSAGSGPWVTDFEAMAMKTAIIRLAKYLPASVELHTAIALDEQAEVGVAQDLRYLIDGPDEDPAPPTKGKKLDTLVANWVPSTPPPAPAEPSREEAQPEEPPAPEPPVDAAPEAAEEEDGQTVIPLPPQGSMARSLTLSVIMSKRTSLKIDEAEFARLASLHCGGLAKLGQATPEQLQALLRAMDALPRRGKR
jgi:recombination protein RecT